MKIVEFIWLEMLEFYFLFVYLLFVNNGRAIWKRNSSSITLFFFEL